MKTEQSRSKGDILIVDDIPENLKLLFTMLSEQGYEVRRVLSGKHALQVVELDPPDLILLDIKMPQMDGYEVCRQLKQSPTTQYIPIIFLSALNETFDKVKAFEMGGSDYISKPFQLPEVLIRVGNQLELLRSRNALKQKNQELEQINQELEAFSHRVSHDLKNPLNHILGFTDMVRELLLDQNNPTAIDQALEFLDIVHDATIRMSHLTTSLLRLSNLKHCTLNVGDVDLTALVVHTFERLRFNNSERLVALETQPKVVVRGDQSLLAIAIENLCQNAWKYTQQEDMAQVKFGVLLPEEQNSDLLAQSGGTLVYFIKDNGVGFAMEQAQNLFSPFSRLHDNDQFEGSGIGLSIVKGIIEKHHGQLWCQAAQGQGATFFFTLPNQELSQ